MQFLTYAQLDVPRALRASFDKVREAIERDDFATPEIKKLTGRPFFRAKLDYENRLLVQFVEHDGKRACLALELILNHAYDRSRFLRGARIDESRALDSAHASDDTIAGAMVPVRYLHTGRTEFHLLDKPISFDDRQGEIHRHALPIVLVGCAGSGKTALTITKLRELSGRVLYTTQSPFLAETAASLYFAHGYENANQDVDFLSYRALLESIDVPTGRAVSLREFRSFFERHRSDVRFTTAHQAFEEIRGVVAAHERGPLSEEAYLELGVRQSIYKLDERRAIYRLWGKYRTWLADAGLYDPNLVANAYRARAEPHYDAIVVDEVQDLTNAELALVLALLKEPKNFLLCGDANQIVHPNFFSWSKLKSLFYLREEDALAAPVHVLDVNYRSSRAVCDLANLLLKTKNARFGSVDRESTALVRPASRKEGRAVGLVKKDAVLRELNQKTKSSAHVAVIVLSEENKAEAKQRFSTPLVFSVHEAKGLEYETVILYDVVSSARDRFAEIATGVSASDLERDELAYARASDKTDKSLEVYKFFVNALYVALTRAVDTVYVVESDAQHPLLGLLRLRFSEDLSGVQATSSSLEEWQREARNLELQGKQEQAENIRQRILQIAPVPWPVLDKKGFMEAHDKAFAPGSVFNKAKQHLFEFAAYHDLGSLADSLTRRAGYVAQRPRDVIKKAARDRIDAAYAGGDLAKVFAAVDRYGLEHKNMMGMTPLMTAAAVGNVKLSEGLVERGAALTAVDTLGRMPIHFALRFAFDPEYASSAENKLGSLYEVLCPTSVDIQVDGRLVRLARSQGEFAVLLIMVARFHELYARLARRRGGFSSTMLDEKALAVFPRSVIPDERRRRTYWNGVLARAEVDSTYRPARKLWRRERLGHYVPSSDLLVRIQRDTGNESWAPLVDVLGMNVLDQHGL